MSRRRSDRNARSREFRLWAGATLAVGLLFGLWPALDLRLAALFYDPSAGAGPAGFTSADQPLVLAIYKIVPILGWLGCVLGLMAWTWPLLVRGRWAGSPELHRWRRRLMTLLALLVLGLVLAVHVLFKDSWGRPRPEHVQEFGGARIFQPWWQPSRQCRSNCSFVSGHAGTGYALLGLGLLAAPRARRRWLVAGTLAGVGIGLVRMVQGGHFASDILGAGLVMWGVGIAIRRGVLSWRWRRRCSRSQSRSRLF